jgi:hypothetical protein
VIVEMGRQATEAEMDVTARHPRSLG